MEESAYVSNAGDAQALHLPTSAVVRQGRVTGYRVMFGRFTNAGVCCIENSVTQWRDSVGAAAGYLRLVRELRATYAGRGAVTGYLDAGQRYYDIFACRCDSRVEGVVQIVAHKGDFVSTVELRFLPNTIAPQTVAALATHYSQLVLSRIAA
jgi:hypothetical protein